MIVNKTFVTVRAEYEYNHQLLHWRASTPFTIMTLLALSLPFFGHLMPTSLLDTAGIQNSKTHCIKPAIEFVLHEATTWKNIAPSLSSWEDSPSPN